MQDCRFICRSTFMCKAGWRFFFQGYLSQEAGQFGIQLGLALRQLGPERLQLAQGRNLPHADHDDLMRLAIALDEEQGTPGSHFVRFEAARAMYDNGQMNFLDLEETLMSPENARELIRCLSEYHTAE